MEWVFVVAIVALFAVKVVLSARSSREAARGRRRRSDKGANDGEAPRHLPGGGGGR
jgi:hypothetical protein